MGELILILIASLLSINLITEAATVGIAAMGLIVFLGMVEEPDQDNQTEILGSGSNWTLVSITD